MRAEHVIYTLLSGSALVTAQVGNRIYPARMPQNTVMPALVYQTISGNELTPIDAQAGYQVMRTRIQVTAMAKNYQEVKNALEAVRKACLYQSGVIGGYQVLSITRDTVGPDLRDDDLSIYIQSIDFMVMHYET
jgi:hypothetical protein